MSMKFFYVYLIFSFSFCLVSCDKNDSNSEVQQMVNTLSIDEINDILIPYLYLNGNQYELNLSKDDALKAGIPEIQYKEIICELNRSNEFVKKHVNDPNHVFLLGDPQKVDEIMPTRTVYDIETEEGIQGIRNVSGGDSSFTLSIPRGYKTVRISALSECLFGSITVTIESKSATFWAYSGTEDFSIGMSPCEITVSVSTCTSGGTVGFTIMK